MDPKDIKQYRDAVIAASAGILALASLFATANYVLRSNPSSTSTNGHQPINIYNNPAPLPPPSHSEPVDAPQSDSEDEKKPEAVNSIGPAEKRWKQTVQFWSEMEYQWKDKEEPVLSPEEIEKAKQLLFVVKIRVYDSRDEEETILHMEGFRPPLKQVLKEVLTDVEEVHDEEPNITATTLFRYWDDLVATLARKEEESKGNTSSTADSSTQTTNDVEDKAVSDLLSAEDTSPAPSSVEKKSKKKKVNSYTAEELVDQIDQLKELLKFLETQYGQVRAKVERMRQKGVITYPLLWCIFKTGQECVSKHEDSGDLQGFTLKSMEYGKHPINGKFFKISGQFVEWQGKKFVRSWVEVQIKRFTGARRLANLDVRPMSEQNKTDLIARGTSYKQYCGRHYVQYEGDHIVVNFDMMGNKIVRKSAIKGRVMVDREVYASHVPSGYGNGALMKSDGCQCPDCLKDYSVDITNEADDEDDEDGDEVAESHDVTLLIKDSELCLLPPTVFAFSFGLREWGQVRINFSPIQFDDKAFDHLVLDDTHKTVIRSLVESTRNQNYESNLLIGDMIAGKGGGAVICVFGRPGVGKTLSAEAVAEHLQRPLYMVSSGQLSMDPGKLEDALRDTFSLAEKWEAVLLIDEADVFLEARSQHEIGRNSLVAVFLKALEYHSGILFLTTNRVDQFDEAFVSRFSVAIKYSDLSEATRRHIWRHFLGLAKVRIVEPSSKKARVLGQTPPESERSTSSDGDEEDTSASKSNISLKDLDWLVAHETNGRVIKQVIRASQAIAIAAKEDLSIKHLKMMLTYQKNFTDEFKKAEIDYSAPDSRWSDRVNLYH